MGGRPRALDDTKRREICAWISAGCNIAAAAKFVGCNAVTIRREATRNQGFYEDLRKAELAAQALPLQAMRKAAGSNWRAAAWLLERTQPQAFGLRRPWHCSMDDINEDTEIICEVVEEEVTDRDDVRRVWERISALCAHFASQQKAMEAPRRDIHSRRERAKILRQVASSSKPRPFRSTNEFQSKRDADDDASQTTLDDEDKSK